MNGVSLTLVVDRCFRVSSEQRLARFLETASVLLNDEWWSAFAQVWPVCDDTWHLRDHVLDEMRARRQVHYRRKSLVVRCYRGCSFERAHGIAWTTDRKVAEEYARGHRQIRVPEPIIVQADIREHNIFVRSDERDESELILDPRCLLFRGFTEFHYEAA